MAVQIITDSAADLPKELIQEYSIDVMPLRVYLGEKEYIDGETIQPLEVFQNMREGTQYKTAQVPLQVFEDIFSKYAEKGQSCIYIAFSSELSGTYQSSVMAKQQVLEEYPDFDIEVIDTKAASMGFGLIVKYAAQMAQKGKTKEEIVEAIHFFSNHMEHIFTVDNLEYLYRGGRVSRTAAFVGGILNIKPVLHVEDGKLIPLEKIRGRKKVIKRMVDIMEERGVDYSNQTIGISHGDDMEAVEALMDQIKERLGCKEFIITLVGSTIGSHSGPGTLALFFLNKEIPDRYKS
ncbi:DegV family protein [Irregularibacter muris]|uniref:DegV family protein n=1 Tax=Irregularibacter muris TaxID=1796619 RepID=A0AAE3L2G3_9FIRM|nr:DegV family protein [Irregularibacter muris]MCR1898514.1 DegV family protein [Irregularibacter muris]